MPRIASKTQIELGKSLQLPSLPITICKILLPAILSQQIQRSSNKLFDRSRIILYGHTVMGNYRHHKFVYLLFHIHISHTIVNIRPIEAGHQDLGAPKLEALHDVLLHVLWGSSSECHQWHLREIVSESSKVAVGGSKVVAPRADAVCFVNCKQTNGPLGVHGSENRSKPGKRYHTQLLKLKMQCNQRIWIWMHETADSTGVPCAIQWWYCMSSCCFTVMVLSPEYIDMCFRIYPLYNPHQYDN